MKANQTLECKATVFVSVKGGFSDASNCALSRWDGGSKRFDDGGMGQHDIRFALQGVKVVPGKSFTFF